MKLLSPVKRRRGVGHVRDALDRKKVSERRACRILGQSRSTQRLKRNIPHDEPRLIRRTVKLASEFGRNGYRRITAMLRREGWRANHKRVERLGRREGLKVPAGQPKRKRLWLGDESRAEIDHGGVIVVQTVKQSIGNAKSCVNGNKKVSGTVFSSHKLRNGER